MILKIDEQTCDEPLCKNHVFVQVEHNGKLMRVCFEHYREILKIREDNLKSIERWKTPKHVR